MAIVDTRQFSRLKKLRQNGNCSHVFMNANHSRFEHSLGKHLHEVELEAMLNIELYPFNGAKNTTFFYTAIFTV
jgi:hypothetical protein